MIEAGKEGMIFDMQDRNRFILSFFQDRRLRSIASILLKEGYEMGIAGCTLPAGMPDGIVLCPNPREWISKAGIVLLPLPAVKQNDTIAFSEEEISFHDLLSGMRKDSILLGGMLPERLREEARLKGIRVHDYYGSEEVMLRNAELTAEAAVYIAMQELSRSISETRIAVVGCGRIGNALCAILRTLGAEVTAISRREVSLETPKALGCAVKPLSLASLRELSEGYDVVFNTVPSRIFTPQVLSTPGYASGGDKTLYVDLSSAPGGFDPVAARSSGIHLLWALSLPGKYAPDSAGRVLGRQMARMLREEREDRP